MAGEALEPGDEGAGQPSEDAGGMDAEKVEHGRRLGESGVSHGIRRRESHVEALKRGRTTSDPSGSGNGRGKLEQVRCSSSPAILASLVDLVELVGCEERYRHRLCSDRGPVRLVRSTSSVPGQVNLGWVAFQRVSRSRFASQTKMGGHLGGLGAGLTLRWVLPLSRLWDGHPRPWLRCLCPRSGGRRLTVAVRRDRFRRP